ncbi:site-2 protease family protein [Solibacillus sp. FSL H8-0538]|uniref:site-2 protease family protein n=1 Tax=Solibacillus sp. FSL H8-0538 TaxID=2921400 RepID=UPI0030FA62C2
MIRIHPLFLVVLMGIAVTGNLAVYSFIILSLVWHEIGHLLAARYVNVKVKRCIIMPYGGEITVEHEGTVEPYKWLIIALGGPLATVLGMLLTLLLPPLVGQPLFNIQRILLLLNLLPIWPLDGGKILCNGLLVLWPKAKVYETFLSLSVCFLTIIVVVTLLMLPRSASLAVLSLFLWSKVIGEWRIRKYRSAFQKVVMNRLT